MLRYFKRSEKARRSPSRSIAIVGALLTSFGVLALGASPAQGAVASIDNFESYTVLEDTDRQAFLDGDSSRYEMTIEQTVRIPLLGSATQVIEQVYRRVEGPEGQPWIISRVLSPAGVDFSSSIVAIDQQYNLYVIHPLPEGARRIEAFWVEARFIGVDIPDSVAVDNFASGVDDQAARVDDYLDGL